MEFIPGLNVLIGQSNNGKSACLRALETAIYNLSREGHVTLGETKSLVGIQYKGHQVIWRRDTESSSQVSYRVDGKIYTKLGKGQPEIVSKVLGISEVEINDRKYRINFGKQMTYPFLLDLTPSELFKFIIQSSEEDNITSVLDSMRKDANQLSIDVKSDEVTRNELGKTYQRELGKYKGKREFVPYCNKVLELDSKVKGYKSLSDSVESYEKCSYAIQKSEKELRRIEYKVSNVDNVCNELESKFSLLNELKKTLERYMSLNRDIDLMGGELKECTRVLNLSEGFDDIYGKFMRILETKKEFESFIDLKRRYEDSCKLMSGWNDEVSKVNSRVSEYDSILEVVNKKIRIYEEIKINKEEIEGTICKYGGFIRDIEEYQKNISKAEFNAKAAELEIKELGVCPYCSQPLNNYGGCNHGC